MVRTTLLVLSASLATAAHASGNEIASAFYVSKSLNSNQVHYAVRVDDACRVTSVNPVRPYWRMLERGPNVTEELTDREQQLLGITRQRVEGGEVTISVRALPSRPITIRTWRAPDGTCASAAYVTFQHQFARLQAVHAVIRWFHLDALWFLGRADDGTPLRERVEVPEP